MCMYDTNLRVQSFRNTIITNTITNTITKTITDTITNTITITYYQLAKNIYVVLNKHFFNIF